MTAAVSSPAVTTIPSTSALESKTTGISTEGHSGRSWSTPCFARQRPSAGGSMSSAYRPMRLCQSILANFLSFLPVFLLSAVMRAISSGSAPISAPSSSIAFLRKSSPSSSSSSSESRSSNISAIEPRSWSTLTPPIMTFARSLSISFIVLSWRSPAAPSARFLFSSSIIFLAFFSIALDLILSLSITSALCSITASTGSVLPSWKSIMWGLVSLIRFCR
mmetsp:Transcript_24700/g.59893  ORF Transcript_24700/g.59893 Transcript_24700/m.59893 type:complete len:220 (+) Transcript_24700:3895-4554(+)